MNTIHYSSKTVEWSTPQALFDKLDGEFGFTWDVCATPGNAKCARYYTEDRNGLEMPWAGTCWMNPPYGYGIGKWTAKARTEAGRGVTVVGLLPAKTETAWWFDDVLAASEIRFYRGRIRFGGCNVNAPFPSAVVVWEPNRAVRIAQVRWYTPSAAERGVSPRPLPATPTATGAGDGGTCAMPQPALAPHAGTGAGAVGGADTLQRPFAGRNSKRGERHGLD